MTLTHYVSHVTIVMILFSILTNKNLFEDLTILQPTKPIYILLFSIAYFVFSYYFSKLWTMYFKNGPLKHLCEEYLGDRRTDQNSGLAKVAVQCSAETFVVNQTLVLRKNICGKNRRFAKPQNGSGHCKTTHKQTVKSKCGQDNFRHSSRTYGLQNVGDKCRKPTVINFKINKIK